MTTREQILKDIITDAMIRGIDQYDLICYCYNILSVYYNSLEESLYDFSCDIVNSIIAYYYGNIDSLIIDFDNRKVLI